MTSATIRRRRTVPIVVAALLLMVAGIASPVAAAPSGPAAGAAPGSAKCQYQAWFTAHGATDRYLSVANRGGKGTRVLLWSRTNGPEQMWCEEYAVQGGAYLHPSYNLGLCLDIPGGDYRSGAHLQVWTCNGRQNQRFTRGYPIAGNPTVTWRAPRFTNDPRALCLDNHNLNQGNVVQLYRCNSTAPQQWTATGTVAVNGHRSNGLGENIAWQARRQVGADCLGSTAAFTIACGQGGDWCTAFSRSVWNLTAVQNTDVLNNLAPSFADGDSPGKWPPRPNGRGYGTRFTSYDTAPRVGDVLVWVDYTAYHAAHPRFERPHAEVVVWVKPGNANIIETVGGDEGDPGRVRFGGPNRGPYDWTKGEYNKGNGPSSDNHLWTVYQNRFTRPRNA